MVSEDSAGGKRGLGGCSRGCDGVFVDSGVEEWDGAWPEEARDALRLCEVLCDEREEAVAWRDWRVCDELDREC